MCPHAPVFFFKKKAIIADNYSGNPKAAINSPSNCCSQVFLSYFVLQAFLQVFLIFIVIDVQVSAESEVNKMTNANLAVVFGPNLLWGQDASMTLSAIGPINNFTRILLDLHQEVFTQ